MSSDQQVSIPLLRQVPDLGCWEGCECIWLPWVPALWSGICWTLGDLLCCECFLPLPRSQPSHLLARSLGGGRCCQTLLLCILLIGFTGQPDLCWGKLAEGQKALSKLGRAAPFKLFRIFLEIIISVVFILPFLDHELRPQGVPQMLPPVLSMDETCIYERNAVNYSPIEAADFSEESWYAEKILSCTERREKHSITGFSSSRRCKSLLVKKAAGPVLIQDSLMWDQGAFFQLFIQVGSPAAVASRISKVSLALRQLWLKSSRLDVS